MLISEVLIMPKEKSVHEKTPDPVILRLSVPQEKEMYL